MKGRFSLALMVVAAFVLALSLPVQASKTDDQIISSAKKSYVFKHNLKDDDIKIFFSFEGGSGLSAGAQRAGAGFQDRRPNHRVSQKVLRVQAQPQGR